MNTQQNNREELRYTMSQVYSFWLAVGVALFGSMWLMYGLSIGVQLMILHFTELQGHFKEMFYGSILLSMWACNPMISQSINENKTFASWIKTKLKMSFSMWSRSLRQALQSFL